MSSFGTVPFANGMMITLFYRQTQFKLFYAGTNLLFNVWF